MTSGTGMELAGLLVLAAALVIVLVSIRFAVPLLTRYTRALAGGYGFGKQPHVADVMRAPSKQPKDDHEPAYDHYLFGQAWQDIRHAQVLGLRAFREDFLKSWKEIVEKRMRPRVNENLPPEQRRSTTRRISGSILVVCLGLGALLAALLLVASGLVQGFVLGLLFAVMWVLLYALRGADSVVLYVRGVTKTCKNCGHRLVRVTYACDKCQARHKNLRPGRYGTLRRFCACGNKLPTLTLTRMYELPAWCPNCDKQLARKTGRSPEIVLPVFGAPLAGKTQLITVLLLALETLVERTGGKFDYADDTTRTQVTKSRQSLANNRTDSTTPINAATGTLVHPAYSLHIEPKRGRPKLLHVFDAAGEIFRQERNIEQLVYLRLAHTYIFVIDPLSIEPLWRGIDTDVQQKLAKKRATDEPHVVFAETLQTVTGMGINTSKIRLIVAVSKADLVADLIHDVDARDSQSIRMWLSSLDQGHMIRAMELHFGQVSFFLTAATTDAHQQADTSVEVFARQTLSAEGLRLHSMSR